ncbi:MAG: protein kinase, partial [Planctomycetes bacterium]|nr:protein kinase [Planctomycetota bacterium]
MPDPGLPPLPADEHSRRLAFQLAATIQDPGGAPAPSAGAGGGLGATIRDDDGAATRPDGPSSSSSTRLQTALEVKAGLAVPGSPTSARYSINGVVGQGATSQVFDALDHTFDRHIAVKYLHGEKAMDARRIARFMKEAKVTARLEHPNIAPVHDMDFTVDGGIYFTMRMITGTSLGDAVQAARAGRPAPQIATYYQRVSLFLRVAEALACAHARRILHRDIKPDNIMLGAFGEVVLVDWGSALVLDEDGPRSERVVGTPNYMSPEQARSEPVDERSDIHCLGAALFEVLTLRLPLSARNDAEFWERKRRGAIDPPSAEEAARVPKRLLAIALKAMAPIPSQRYATVQEFADDLSRYQAGLAISAYRDSTIERLLRWHRQHARSIWGVAALLAVMAVAGSILYGERLKEMATWGRPIVNETFTTDASWQKDWGTTSGSFAVREGMLVSADLADSMAFYRQRLNGSIAIEYDGRFLPDSPPCDLSVLYALDDPFVNWGRAWWMQVGAYDNSYVHIVRAGDNLRCDLNLFQLEQDRTYRIRVEIEDDVVRILIDGRLICEHREPVPFTSGWIGLYGYYPGKAFDNLRIYSKGIPEKVSALAIGDGDFADGLFDRAATHYRRVADVHADKAIGQEARYKLGLALRTGGHGSAAYAEWARLVDEHWLAMVAVHRLEDRIPLRQYAEVADGILALYVDHPDLRQRLRTLWIRAVESARGQQVLVAADLDALLSVHDRAFPHEDDANETAARALQSLERYDELLARFPEQVVICGDVLRQLGRRDEVLARYPTRRYDVAWSLFEMGRFEDALAIRPPVGWVHDRVDDFRGRPERWDDPAAWLAKPGVGDYDRMTALTLLGRFDDAVAVFNEKDPVVMPALLLRHDWDLARAGFARSRPLLALIDCHQALVDLGEGRDAQADALLARADPGAAWFREYQLWFAYLLARP